MGITWNTGLGWACLISLDVTGELVNTHSDVDNFNSFFVFTPTCRLVLDKGLLPLDKHCP